MRYVTLLAVCACWVRPCCAIEFGDLLDSYDVLQTVAGTGLIPDKSYNGWEPEMEGGPAIQAELSRPHMTMADNDGNLYIADKDAHAIRFVSALDGTIHTIAGTNAPGYNGDGLGTETMLSAPNGLYTFPDGTTYILDLGNSLIRRLGTDGNLTTVVDDPFGIQIGRGLWVSPDESTIYYSSGTEVRRWTEDEGIEIYADGFVALGNLDVDPSDQNVVVTDREGHGVYKIYADGETELIAGNQTTFGGGDGELALDTGLKEVRGVAFHPEGGYFLATHDGGQVWFVDDRDVIHLLIDGDDDRSTHAGDGQPLGSPGRMISEPRAVTLSPHGDLIVTEHDAGFVRFVRATRPIGVEGDFNHNGVLDANDMDLLTDEVLDQSDDRRFDLNGDSKIDQLDRERWVNDLKGTYFGDADFDGEFNSGDLVAVFQAKQYDDGVERNSGWATGDWNGDREFDSGDLVAAFSASGYDAGPRRETADVPEPNSLALGAIALGILAARRRS